MTDWAEFFKAASIRIAVYGSTGAEYPSATVVQFVSLVEERSAAEMDFIA